MESPGGIKGVRMRRNANGSALELHPAMAANKWQKGQSGNPSGKGGRYHETIRIARENSPAAMQKLADLMNCGDYRVEAVAANALLERAFGKPKEFDPKAETTGVPVFDPRAVTPQQLEMIKQAMQLMAQAMTIVEVEND